MENSNNLLIQQNTKNTKTVESQVLTEENLFDELDSLFENLEELIPEKNSPKLRADFKSQANVNELKELEEEVVFIENKDIVKDKSEYIASLEQNRMQKLLKKDLLVRLGKDRINAVSEGKSYSRGMDEGVLLNTTKKDHLDVSVFEKEETIKNAMKEESIADIIDVSEEFNEEFVNDNKASSNKYKNIESQEEDSDNGDEKNKDSNDDEHAQQLYQIEDDEFLLLDITKEDEDFIKKMNIGLNDLNDKVKKIPHAEVEKIKAVPKERDLMVEIERRINRIAPVIDKKVSKLKPTFKKTKAVSNFRKKFNKH